MAVVVRLRRMGTNKKPFFRIVATDERCSNKGKYLENLGWYDPKKSEENFSVNLERVDYWCGVGARTTETVDSILKKARKQGGKPSVKVPAPKTDDELKVKKVSELPEEELKVQEVDESPTSASEPVAELEETKAEDSEEVKKEAPE